MDNSTRRGPSGFFMALLGICALALLVVMIYGVAISNPDMVKQLMGVSDQTDDALGGDMGYGGMTGDMSGDMTGDMAGDMAGNMTGDMAGDMTGDMSGDMTGDMSGDMTGDMAGDMTSEDAGSDDTTDGDAQVGQQQSEGEVMDSVIAVG